MDVPLIVAGCLALFAASAHGAGGEVWVVRKLSTDVLPPTRFGGPRMTKAMVHVSWHITTLAFVTAACAFLLAGAVLDGDAARAIGLFSAAAFTGFAVVAAGIGAAHNGSPRAFLRHPGPLVMAATAALGWWGAL